MSYKISPKVTEGILKYAVIDLSTGDIIGELDKVADARQLLKLASEGITRQDAQVKEDRDDAEVAEDADRTKLAIEDDYKPKFLDPIVDVEFVVENFYDRSKRKQEEIKNKVTNVVTGKEKGSKEPEEGDLTKTQYSDLDYVDDEDTIVKEASIGRPPAYNEEHYAKLYKETGDKKYKDLAAKSLENVVYKYVTQINRSKSINNAVLVNKGMGYVYNAIDTWNPDRSKLATHVTNTLMPLTRYIYKYSPGLHIPEHRIGNWLTINNAIDSYKEMYGDGEVDPKAIATMTGVKVKDVEKALKEKRSMYNDSAVNTTNVSYEEFNYKADLDYLDSEFAHDPVKSKLWKEIKRLAKANKKINATTLSQATGIDYYTINKIYTDIIQDVNKALATIG
jgi:hypothetical protein